MSRAVPGILSFTSGELSPLLDARVDIDKYFSGCKACENFITTVQGPAVRRPGTRYVSTTKANGNAWLGRFVFNRGQSYILEFGDNYIRFYTNRGVLLSGGAPLEVPTPWAYSDITTAEGTFGLQFAQSGDILYIVNTSGLFRPMKLSRLGQTNWTLTNLGFDRGPFKDVDPLNAITITPSALTGAITLTASSGIFSPLHVGTQIYLEQTDLGVSQAWETNKAVVLNDVRRYNGNAYVCAVAGTTGTLPPTHIRGTFKDGSPGASWTYIHSGYGIATITGFTSTTVVNATVNTGEGLGIRLPGNGVGIPEIPQAFVRWAFNDVSDIEGWPVAIDFAYERLTLAKSRTVYMSEVGIYESWAAKTGFETDALNAIRYPVNLKGIDVIRWLSFNKDLLVGTDAFEFSIQPQTDQQVFGPGNIRARPQSEIGSRTIQPIEIDNATVHVQDAGLRLRQLLYSYEIERYQPEDLTILSEHIPSDGGGIIDICRQKETDPVLWSVLADGSLAGTTYSRVRGIVGWHKHTLGGFANLAKTLPAKVKSCEAIASPLRNRDDVWLIVERTINNALVRYIEYIEDPSLLKNQALCFYVDAGLSYDGLNQIAGNLTYNFENNSDLGWTGFQTILGPSFSGLNLGVPSGTDPQFLSPAFSLVGLDNRYVEIDVERTAVRTQGLWQGNLFYSTPGHPFAGGFNGSFPALANVIGARTKYTIDMAVLNNGSNDYLTSTINSFRFDFEDGQVIPTNPNGTFKIHSIRTKPTAENVTAIGGFNHLKNESVQVFGNSGPLGDEMITAGGVLNLDVPVTFACAGLGYTSVITPMRLEPPMQDGTAQSRLKSVSELKIRFKDTLGGRQGLTRDNTDPIPSRPHNLPVGMPTPMFNGDRYVLAPADITTDGFITIVQDQPCPMTLVSIYPRIDVND